MIAADIRFHEFIYELSENPLIAPAMETQLTYTQRVMGEVLMRDERPRDIWDQHEAMLDAVTAGDGATAEALTRQHITQAPRLHGRAAAQPGREGRDRLKQCGSQVATRCVQTTATPPDLASAISLWLLRRRRQHRQPASRDQNPSAW